LRRPREAPQRRREVGLQPTLSERTLTGLHTGAQPLVARAHPGSIEAARREVTEHRELAVPAGSIVGGHRQRPLGQENCRTSGMWNGLRTLPAVTSKTALRPSMSKVARNFSGT